MVRVTLKVPEKSLLGLQEVLNKQDIFAENLKDVIPELFYLEESWGGQEEDHRDAVVIEKYETFVEAK